MARVSAFAIAAASLLPFASGRIVGVGVPCEIKAGAPFTAILETENYIQSIQDVAVSFGYAPESAAHEGYLGVLANSAFLGPNQSNVLKNISETVTIPSSAQEGEITFTAALFSLLGAEYGPSISYFTVKTTIGSETSPDYVSSSSS